MPTTPRRPRATALAAVPPERVSKNSATSEKNASPMNERDCCGRKQASYVMPGVLLALILLTGGVFLLMLFPVFMPARSILSANSKMALCSDFMKESGWSAIKTDATSKETNPSEEICTQEYAPVCGEKQVVCVTAPCLPVQETYSNACAARRALATVVHTGACVPPVEQQVMLTSPVRGGVVASPVILKGMAFGGWFFEGSFPVEITDVNGKVLGEGVAKTNEDWAQAALAGEKIPFTATIVFKKGKERQGFIVLKQDNPSGLPENERSLSVPVTF